MTIKSVVHSNAFNFLSFVQNSVDPRTGQYTLAIELPALVGNDLIGPQLPLRLSFNPFNDQDSGFGQGWNLALSQYVPGTHMLSLHTGESYKVTGSGPQPAIREKKIDSFHFHDDSTSSDQRYRIVHKSGLVEMLTPFGDQQPVALPTRVQAPSGHHLELTYTLFQSQHCLERIVDGNGLQLLQLDYALGQVTLDLHPGAGANGAPFARYTLELSNRQLRKVILPTEDKASWRFEYARVRELTCLKKIWTPVGAVEDIAYEDDGHLLPGGGSRVALPRVTTHLIDPGSGQPPLKTTYTYTYRDPDTGQQAQNNFLGNNSGITWRDDGQDNLYRAQASYKYSTTAHHWLTVDDKEVEARTVERRYNRFHLLESEITRQAGHVQVSETTYHGKVTEAFDNQPNNFQLPRTSTQTWRLDQDAARRRSETVETHYDLHGNLIEEIQPTGVRTVIEYYPAQGDQGCPPDPEGFVRNLKSETVHPAPGGDAPAPVLRTSYRYQALAALAGGAGGFATSASTWLLPCQQTLCEVIDTVERPALQATSFQAIDNVGDVLRHGRALSQTLSMGGQDTTTEYAYRKEVRDGHPVLITEQTLTGFDHGRPGEDGLPRHACKKITLEHSILIGEPLLNRDDNDVEIAYEYDALRRVVRETVAPNDDVYRASREYAYYLVSDAGQQAWQSMTDVKGVITRSLVDGLNRTVSELRHDADAQNSVLREEFRLRYQAAYDGLGQLIEEVQHDWLGNEQIPLRTRYEYDEWGQQCCETGPDLVKHFQHNDPIGTAESGHLPIQTVWSESADGKKRLGKTVTWINPFQQPVQMQRFDLAEKAVSKHEYFYDGLGRTVREIDGRRAVTRHAYDAFDRLVDQTLPDNTVVHRDYAVHSSQDLPTRIQTQERQNIIVLGEQAFDGIDRMVSSTTGGRKRVMFYDPGQRQPRKVMTATGQEIEYQYLPQLSEAPLQRGIPGKQANYVYDAKNARLTSSKEQHQEISRDYFSTGELRLETRRIGEESWNMQYDYSLQGRILSYVDVLGQEQSYTYDQAGRLENTTLGSTRSDFSYDALGSLERIETQDGEQKLTTELEYDELGRETLRRFIHSDTTQELAQTYNAIDQLTRKTLTEQGKLLRDETYDYDLRGRLVSYTCDGPLAPVDPYGKTIREQQFDFDRLDNIVWVFTAFDGADGKLEDNEATYLFENEDPAQLSGIENTHPDYPAKIELLYDGDGNLVQDEQGRTLSYDALGRLMSVELSDGGGARYDYDPLDRLASQES